MRTTLFQAAESAGVGHGGRVQAAHASNTIQKKIWLTSRTAARAKTSAKALILAFGVSIVAVTLNSVQPAKAQNAGREQNIRECNAAEARERPDAEERGKTGSRGFRYKSCMMERGEFE